MFTTRNRELSQFGSFIHIDDNTQSIGITTNSSSPFVGIGTTNPSVKFEVVGNTNIIGTLDASSYTLNGSPLVDATVEFFTFATNNVDIFRLDGNVGIGTSVSTQKLTVNGNVSAGQFISTVTTGTAPLVVLSDTQVTNLNASFLRGKTPPTGDIVGTVDTQTLTNKTLTSPTINTAIIGSAGITFNGTSGTTTLQASATASGTLTLPAATDTLTGKATTDTLTNKTIAAGSNTITGLTNTNLSGSAGISNANLANSTISGVALGSNLNVLTFTDYLISGGTYTGATARTVSVAGTSINTANTLVARDASGDFTAGTVTLSGLTLSGALVISNATQSIDKDTGCLILGGGLGVEKNANIGGMLNVTGITTCAGGLDVTGNITASGTINSSGITVVGVITATSFSGSGANLTGVGGGSTVADDATTNATFYPIFTQTTSGIITASNVSTTKLNFNPSTGTLSATQFTSLSDGTQKTNIRPVENATYIVSQMNGVYYDWVDGHNTGSVGVIAQEMEQVLPEVVSTNDQGLKTVSYGNIVGVLIEAIKEQQVRIEEIKKLINK